VWNTVLLMAAIGTVDPLRIGIAAFLLSRPRPVRMLAIYFVCGFTLNVVIGEGVLAGGRAVLGTEGTIPGPALIAVGVILFVVGAVLGFGWRLAALVGRRPAGNAQSAPGDGPTSALDQVPALAGLPRGIKAALRGESAWVAAALAVGTAWPGAHYLAAMAAILTADPAPTPRLAALVVFNLAEFSAALVPMASFWLAPAATRALVDRVSGWMRLHHRFMLTAIMWTVSAIFFVMGIRYL
jgi:hypothetical protein